MKIKITTELLTIEIEDNATIGSDGYTKRHLPELPSLIKNTIDEVIRLNNELKTKLLN
jgi:hypothetical protein